MTTLQQHFRAAYGAQREAEGRAIGEKALFRLPYLTDGPIATQWMIRARTFDAFVDGVVALHARVLGRSLRVADLGAGNGWLSWHMARQGHHATAVDLRDDSVDGLAAAQPYLQRGHVWFDRVVGSFDAVPVANESFDLVVFNASLHYSIDLGRTLSEARRLVGSGGRIAILDSPFYRKESDGESMVREKHRDAIIRFGQRAEALMALPFIEYLTEDRLRKHSASMGVAWTRHRVRYPLRYELRPLLASVRGRRAPSRFDVWEGVVA